MSESSALWEWTWSSPSGRMQARWEISNRVQFWVFVSVHSGHPEKVRLSTIPACLYLGYKSSFATVHYIIIKPSSNRTTSPCFTYFRNSACFLLFLFSFMHICFLAFLLPFSVTSGFLLCSALVDAAPSEGTRSRHFLVYICHFRTS